MQEDLALLADGRVLAYATYGSPDGCPLFLMHGCPGSRRDGALFDEGLLAELHVRLIVPDRPGLGRSSAHPRRSLAGWPADLAALADALGLELFAVAGISGGGPYALAAAAALPDRVTGLALISSLGPLSEPGLARAMGPGRLLFTPWLAPLYARLMRAAIGDPRRALERVLAALPPEDQACFAEWPELGPALLASMAEAFRQGPRGLAQDARLLGGPWRLDLAGLVAPTWLWHGEADRNAPVAMGRYLADTVPGCQAIVLPGEGHFGPLCRHSEAILATLISVPETEALLV